MMMLVPIYFQITDRASFTTAGAHLRASVFGNAVRGLLTGYVIHKYVPVFASQRSIESASLTKFQEPVPINPSFLSLPSHVLLHIHCSSSAGMAIPRSSNPYISYQVVLVME